MKKMIVALLALMMTLSLVACGGQGNTPSTGTPDASTSNIPDFDMQTSESNPIVNIGTVDKSLYKTPVLVTSFGQSTDASMVNTVMKKTGVQYTYDVDISADAVSGYKTIIIAVGASSKGLGAAGISEADETARAKAIMDVVKKNDIEVICCHIGGGGRRGALSDQLTDMVLAESSYMILKEDANFDYKYTKYAEDNKLPLTLIYTSKDIMTVIPELFS